MANTFKNGANNGLPSSYSDIMACPNNTGDTCVVLSLMLTNVGTNGQEFSCSINDASDNVVVQLAEGMSITAESALELCPNKFILTQGQKIRASANSTNVKCFVSYMEST